MQIDKAIAEKIDKVAGSSQHSPGYYKIDLHCTLNQSKK